MSDDASVDLSEIPEDDNGLYYKDAPYTPQDLSAADYYVFSKYARYQKSMQDAQVERAEKMLSTGTIKKERRNPNESCSIHRKIAATEDGNLQKIHNYLDTEKIEQEALCDGIYAVTTDLLDDKRHLKKDIARSAKVVGKLRMFSHHED